MKIFERIWRNLLSLGIATVALSGNAWCQQNVTQVEKSLDPIRGGHARVVQPTLSVVARQAGFIFAGKVMAISRRTPATPDEVASVQVTFHVEQGLRGARTGQDLTVAEWAGLWNGVERYRVGERVLLFLYPNSKLGLTSPVGGRQGQFEVDRSGTVVLSEEHRLPPGLKPIIVRNGNRIPLRQFTRAIRRMAMQEEP